MIRQLFDAVEDYRAGKDEGHGGIGDLVYELTHVVKELRLRKHRKILPRKVVCLSTRQPAGGSYDLAAGQIIVHAPWRSVNSKRLKVVEWGPSDCLMQRQCYNQATLPRAYSSIVFD
jgi:hypothetical protein